MVDLLYYPDNELPSSLQISAGTIADFVSGLSSDPSDTDRPSLSGYFTQLGVDAGLAYHDNAVQVYAQANPWTINEVNGPAEGQTGEQITRSGYLSFGAMAGGDGAKGYVEGRYSVQFGQTGWVPPESGSYEMPVFDDDGNQIGVENESYQLDGYHELSGPVTTLSILGYADTDGAYHAAGIAEHERSLTVSGRDFDLSAVGAIGVDHEYGTFAMAAGELRTILHGDTGTSLYGRGEVLIAQNDEFSRHSIGVGIITSAPDSFAGGNGVIPAMRAGVEYDGNEVRPSVGIDFKF